MFAAGVKPNSQHHVWCSLGLSGLLLLSSVLFLLEAHAAPQHRILRAYHRFLVNAQCSRARQSRRLC
jgi:hypothetical protein